MSSLKPVGSYIKAKKRRKKEHEPKVQKEIITDHAVLRYIERHHQIDIKQLRKELLTPTMKNMIEFGAEGIKTETGQWKVRDGRIVTFISNKG